jgi:polyphosphate kinase
VPKTQDKRSRRRAKSPNGPDPREAVAGSLETAPALAGGAHPAGAALPATIPTAADLPVLLPEMFINRELSWLEFNNRVLFEAEQPTNPLLERVKFASIFASNLDEFFMIRVAGIKRKIAAGVAIPGPDGRTPIQQLQAVRQRTQEALGRHAAIITRELLPGLAAHGIVVLPYVELSDIQKASLARRFEEDIFPILTPQAIDRGRRFPHVSNQSLNLIAALRLADGSRYARVKIPATLPRLVPVPNGDGEISENGAGNLTFTWLEDVVAANLPRLFAGATVTASYPFHVTRDFDLELDDEDGDDQEGDLMVTLREGIAQR